MAGNGKIPPQFMKRAKGKLDENSPQTLQGNGAEPPAVKRDKITVTSGKKGRVSPQQLSQARRDAIKKKFTGAEDSGAVDSPLGRRLKDSGKKNPFLRVN